MKRLFDAVCAGAGLIVLFPVMAVCALAVRLSSPGPILFRQRRVGRHGRPFDILKFRTMRSADGEGPQITIGQDPRITRAGILLRKWKLDELPQLWNVVAGEMSLVGPRPEVQRYVDLYPEASRELVLSVRPGITDPSSLLMRDESDILAQVDDPERYYVETLLPEKLRISGEYVRTQTLISDIGVILQTLAGLLRARNSA